MTELHYGNKHANYTYNADGIRTEKTVNGVTTQYYLNGSQILTQITEDERIDFLYDETGSLFGLKYGGQLYYYVRNLQGDIIEIINQYGISVVTYRYDSWGNLLELSGSMWQMLGEYNPFRYRGYYYDTESKLYYLNSRYYDPETGRFINADRYISTGQGVLGNNMYAYCQSNPVNYTDPSGEIVAEISVLYVVACSLIAVGLVGLAHTASNAASRSTSDLGGISLDVFPNYGSFDIAIPRNNVNNADNTAVDSRVLECTKRTATIIKKRGKYYDYFRAYYVDFGGGWSTYRATTPIEFHEAIAYVLAGYSVFARTKYKAYELAKAIGT